VKRFRWVAIGLAGLALAGAVTAGVMARSSSYGPGVIGATGFSCAGDSSDGMCWLRSSRQQATWTFDVSSLPTVVPSYVFMNFSAQTTNNQGGCGFGSTLSIVLRSGSLQLGMRGELVNPWKPQNAVPALGASEHEVGWQTYAATSVPRVLLGTKALTVTISPATLSRQVGVDEDSLHIGYFVG
jgi:hypothetical protein